MNRILLTVGALAVVALALLILGCGADPTPTTAPAPTTSPTAPPATATPPPTTAPAQAPTRAAPAPTQAVPTPEPTPDEPEETDPSDAYFAMNRVLEVSIEIDPDDWDTLRHQTRTFDDLMAEIEKYQLSRPFADIYDWFSATVTIDGETHTEVGVRKKGFLGSQSDTKPSLKLRYDKYVDGQSLGGVMERMTLNNSIQDPSTVNTCLAYHVFAAAGNPAPRCNFATVTVNGKNLGLYVHVEEIKAPMLARHFDSAEGNLYEGTISDFTPEYRGTIEKKTNEDEDDWSDVDAVMAALQDPSEAGLEALTELVDLDRFLSFWATESLVGHWDGYTGDRNNYHFYRESDGKFVFIPWGVDDVFHLKDDPNPFDDISEPPPSVLALAAIPNRLYNISEWRAKYADRLKDILDAVWDEDELLASVDQMAAIVQEHSLPEAMDAAAKDTERVQKFILKRKGEILADITPEPPDWPEPDYGAAAADGVESFELRFETTWGTNGSANPLAEGTVYELNEGGEWVATSQGEAGATAGPASPQEEADIGVRDAALFTVMGLYPDGAIRGVTFWMPVDRVAAGATLAIGVDAGVGGVIWTIPAGGVDPEGFIPVTAGGIQLKEAGTEPGSAIAGTVNADFGDAPQLLGAGGFSGPAEVEFKTSWGTKEDLDPFEAGGAVSHIAVEGIYEPLALLAAIAGHAGPEESALLPGVGKLASLEVIAVQEDSSYSHLTFVMPLHKLKSGTTLVIGQDDIAGGVWGDVWTIEALVNPFKNLWPFTEGTFTLAEAGTKDGAAISASFSGKFGNPTFQTDAPVQTAGTADVGLVINEVAAKGGPVDWFELYNTGDSTIDLSGYVVADDLEDASKRVAFPRGTEIQPGEYLQFEVDSDNWAGFKLGGDEELGVWAADGLLIDSVDWDEGDSGEGQSYARIPDGSSEFQTVSNPTPRAANQP